MRWIKWTMLAALGCLPALALAEQPANQAKPAPNDDSVKFGLRIEVQTDGNKPHVLVLGDGDNDEKGKQAPNTVIVRQLTDQLAKQAMRIVRAHHKGTYLGVVTSEPPTVLRKHLGLHKGMGLVIDRVMPGSPAAEAGLKEYDVVQKLDDQLIVNYEQFTVLIRDHKPGDEVKLAVIHEGKPVTLTAKLVEHEIEEADAGWEGREFEGTFRILPPGAGWRMMPGQGGMMGPRPQGGMGMPGAPLGGFQPGAAINRPPAAQFAQPRPLFKSIKDGDRSYRLTMSPWGQKTFVVTEKNKEVFEGPVNTREQREKVPANAMEKLIKLEKDMMSHLTGNNPGAPVQRLVPP